MSSANNIHRHRSTKARSLGLQQWALLLVVPVIVLTVAVLAWVSYSQLAAASKSRSLDTLEAFTGQFTRHFDTQVSTLRSNLELLSTSPTLESFLRTEGDFTRYDALLGPLLELFTGYEAAYPSYYEIRVVLPDGYEDARYTSRRIPNATEEESDTPFFDALTKATTQQHGAEMVLRNPDDGTWALYGGRGVYLRDQALQPVTAESQLSGFVVITSDLVRAQRQIDDTKSGIASEVFVTTTNGELVLQRSGQARGVDTGLGIRLQKIAVSGQPTNISWNGVEMLVVGRPLPPGLLVFAAMPQSELAAQSRRLLLLVAAIGTVLVVVPGALVMFLVNRRMVRPIRALTNAATRVSSGDLNVTIELDQSREIGKLAHVFTNMARNLRIQRGALEENQKELKRLAFRDTLTGLPNRGDFRRLLEQGIALADRYKTPMGLLFVDLDGFKRVNDTLGHDAGDELLRGIAGRLKHCVRSSDTVARLGEEARTEIDVTLGATTTNWDDLDANVVARLGGDEFTVILNQLTHREDAGIVAQKIIDHLSPPITVQDQDVVTTPSIGIALFPSDGRDALTLLRRADTAMYEAKRAGKGRFRFYSDEMDQFVKDRLHMEQRLRLAIEDELLQLHYQPLVRTSDGLPIAVEALVRWTDAELGFVPPDHFVALAEDVGLIESLGDWVLRTAITQSALWERPFGSEFKICVNIAGEQLLREGFVADLRDALASAGVSPRCLELELTERTVMSDATRTIQTLHGVKTCGVSVAVDDFGTGYSSLAYLKLFPLDVLKIDKRFVTNINEDHDNRAITTAIVALAKALRLHTVAEGVENEHEHGVLRELGVDYLQGWHFAKAMPASECEAWIRERLTPTGSRTQLDV